MIYPTDPRRRRVDARRGDALLWLIVLILLLLLVGGVVLALVRQPTPGWGWAGRSRASVEAVRADLRVLAVAVETYFVDNNAYPEMAPLASVAPHLTDSLRQAGAGNLTALKEAFSGPGDAFSLTSPISYLARGLRDPYSPERAIPYAYYKTAADRMENGRRLPLWVAFSPGPDRRYDLDPAEDIDWYKPAADISVYVKVADFVFDPTNGAESRGDVIRLKD